MYGIYLNDLQKDSKKVRKIFLKKYTTRNLCDILMEVDSLYEEDNHETRYDCYFRPW